MSAANKSSIYLAKNGAISGPFQMSEIESLKASGKLSHYSWIWQSEWLPIDPAPTEDPAKKFSRLEAIDSVISAVCHDFKKAISGTVSKVTSRGCFLTVHADASSQPVRFLEGASLQMNLLVESTNRSVNLTVKFMSLVKSEDAWVYEFEWSQVPDLLLEG